MSARSRDRAVYTRSHPVLFGLVSLTRRAAAVRIGGTVLVHGAEAFRRVLTTLPLDRTAGHTTGGIARSLTDGAGVLFDQEGASHRGARRDVGDALGAAGVARLRPVWTELLARRLAPLRAGGTVDVVELARELTGASTAALLGCAADPVGLARAAGEAAATAARCHLPGWRPPGARARMESAARRLVALAGDERGAVLAVAAVNTMVAALPRAVAWCADDDLWAQAADPVIRPVLVDELLRVLAPTPLLPRVAAAGGTVGGCPVRPGDRLLLVARHAGGGHARGPDGTDPAPAGLAQLVFGVGAHACPGARVARAQLADTLAALAPLRPVVVRAKVDRRAALPGWSTLDIRAGSQVGAEGS